MMTADPNAVAAAQAAVVDDMVVGKYSPRNLELRSLALHQLLITRLREHPERLERIKETLAHWRVVVAPGSQPYVAAWQRLVDEGLDRVVAVALEDSEHAAALRQCSPLGKAIDPKERAAFYKQWNRADHSGSSSHAAQ